MSELDERCKELERSNWDASHELENNYQDIENYKLKLDEVNKVKKQYKFNIKELEKKFQHVKSMNDNLKKDKDSYKEKSEELFVK